MTCPVHRAYALLVGLLVVDPSAAQESPGRQLYLERCASCHGVDLEGQPDWMRRKPDGKMPAPPHDATGHTWHHSDRQLFQIVKDGLASIAPGYQSDMPAFGDVMTDYEINSVLDYIKGTWPERQQDIQKTRSMQADQ